MEISTTDFEAFVGLFVQQFQSCYFWLSSIRIAGITMFQWILGFMAAGVIFTIIRAFSGVGGVAVSSVGAGAAEQIRVAQGEARYKAREHERENKRQAREAERATYEHYKTNRSRREAYAARYNREKGGK